MFRNIPNLALLTALTACAPAELRLPPDTSSINASARPTLSTAEERLTCPEITSAIAGDDTQLAQMAADTSSHRVGDQVSAVFGGAVAVAAIRKDTMTTDQKQSLYDHRDRMLLTGRLKGCKLD
ncbi:hypothetical protein [Acidisphaera sp. L21]|uniref:hypothetical protein n=1 Tax=Acidisphaera sp. L21 TaxID=1641851 RepID=UPI00131D4B73|nr:hypothetical protein [Acidisphaera sp. L21]